jgi:hypothetical protein
LKKSRKEDRIPWAYPPKHRGYRALIAKADRIFDKKGIKNGKNGKKKRSPDGHQEAQD